MIGKCPQCGALVIPNADDTCPHCGHVVDLETPTTTPMQADSVLAYRGPAKPETSSTHGASCSSVAIAVSVLSMLITGSAYYEVQHATHSMDSALGNAMLLITTTPVQFVLLLVAAILISSGNDPPRNKKAALLAAFLAALGVALLILFTFAWR